MIRSMSLLLLFSQFFFLQNISNEDLNFKIKQVADQQANAKYGEKRLMLMSHELYTLSKKANNKEGMLTAIVQRAMIYGNRSDTNECLKQVAEGIPLAEELKDYNYFATLLELKGKALMYAENYREARKRFLEALKTIAFIKDSDKKHVRAMSLYGMLVDYSCRTDVLYPNAGYRDSILYFSKKSYDEAVKISEKNPDKIRGLGQAIRLIGTAYLKQDKKSEAGKYFDLAETILIKDEDKRFLAALYVFRGNLEFDNGNNKKALEYYKTALKLSETYNQVNILEIVYPNLIEYYKKTKDLKQELYYLEKSKSLNDSLSSINNSALITQSEEDRKASEQKQHVWTIYSIVGLLIILVLGLLIYYYKVREIKKLSLQNFDYENNISEEENHTRIKRLESLQNMVKQDDKYFMITFQETFPTLYQKLLKMPELTPSDLELCAYLKLNLQTKEIATYKKTSIGAVDNRKYRLRKKLNIPAEENLYVWITKL